MYVPRDPAHSIAKKMLSQPSIKGPLSWFVTEAPLYNVVEVNWPMPEHVAVRHLPDEVTMLCDHCELEVTNWDLQSGGFGMSGSLHHARYDCRNCKSFSVTIYYSCETKGGKTQFVKVGRVPKFEINPPKELAKALGKHLPLYRKGMTLRHHNFGLGALLYFRRLVEETTAELLDHLEAAVHEAGGDTNTLALIAKARAAQPFEDKVKIAADGLPQHLRLGGANPLALLHKLLSHDIHKGTDEEAIGIVDGMEKVLGYLFTELKAHTEKRKIYAEGLKESMDRLKEKKEKQQS